MPRGLSTALLAAMAIAAVHTGQACPGCQSPENSGLCHLETCRRQVLPQLRESSLKRDAHSGRFAEPTTPSTTNATDHAQLMARQTEKRLSRLGRALAGHRTHSRHSRLHAACS
jgi:hypothetical protein